MAKKGPKKTKVLLKSSTSRSEAKRMKANGETVGFSTLVSKDLAESNQPYH
jgi:hypothetical protein